MPVRIRKSSVAVVASFLFAGLAFAQTITPSVPSIALSVAQSGQQASTTLTVSTSGPGSPFVVSVSAQTLNSSGNWLTATPNTASAQNPNIMVVADSSRLSPGTVYYGQIALTAAQANAPPVIVPVTFTVGTPSSSSLIVDKTSLTFTGQAGGAAPTAQLLNLTSNPSGMSVAVSAATNSGGSWLEVSTGNLTTPGPVAVSINTAGLPVGLYSGNITLTPATGPAVTIPVTLNLTTGTVLSASVSALQFFYQINGVQPAFQTFYVSSGNSLLAVNLFATENDSYHWLNVTPTFFTTPQTVTVTVSAYALPPGVYSGSISLSAPGSANPTLTIPVTLTVSNGPLLTIGGTPSTFVYQTGSIIPAAQTIPIAASSGVLNYTVTSSTSGGSNWLAVSPSAGSTPQNLTVAVSPGSLSPGNYTATITISAPGATNSPVSIPISLTVSTNASLLLNPQAIALNYQIGWQNNVRTQVLRIDSTGQPVQFTAAASTTSCASNWLQISPSSGTTPASVGVSYDTSNLTTPAICTGAVIVTPAGGVPVQVPVTLTVSQTALFNATPLALNFSAPFQANSTPLQAINLSVTDGSASQFTATVNAASGGPSWLSVSPTSGSTPATLSVRANPYSLPVGNYSGSITVTNTTLHTSQLITVNFRITATDNVIAAPAAVSFTQVTGVPQTLAQTIQLSASNGGSLSFATSIFPGNFPSGALTVSANSGTIPGQFTIGVNGQLPPGTYNGSVVLTVPAAGNSPFTIPVSLTVSSTPAPVIASTPATLAFAWQTGTAAPANASLSVTATGAAVNVTAAAAVSSPAGGNWLSVVPASATTPATFTVSVNPGTLTAGSYSGTVTLTPASGPAVTVPVTLTVTVPATSITSVYNAASGALGVISPGEIVSIKGTALGPASGVKLQLASDGTVATTLAGTRVFFGQVAAPILYTSAGQVNVIVPYEVAAGTLPVVVEYQGVRSPAYTVQAGATAPGIFTATQDGQGQGAILNQDNSYNGAATPAARGSIVQVFATGEGVLIPAATTGSVTPDANHKPSATVTATIDGIPIAPADITYAGAAPGQVAGLLQVNLRIPQGAHSGNVPIKLTIGGNDSQSGVTVAVQ